MNSCKRRSSITKLQLDLWGQAWRNSNLICIESKAIHIQNFNWIAQKTAEKSPENWNWAKGNNSCKNRWSVTKLTLDLFYVITNSYTKFEVNISKDDREKSGKLNFSSCKSMSSVTKLKLDLQYVMTNSCTTCTLQVNISNYGREKSGKRNFSKRQ